MIRMRRAHERHEREPFGAPDNDVRASVGQLLGVYDLGYAPDGAARDLDLRDALWQPHDAEAALLFAAVRDELPIPGLEDV